MIFSIDSRGFFHFPIRIGYNKVMKTKQLLDRNEIFEKLELRKVTSVSVAFSGGDDEGYCEEIILIHGDGSASTLSEPYISTTYDSVKQQWVYSRELTDDEVLAESLCKPIYDEFGSFAGDFSVDGHLIWNVKEKTAILKKNIATRVSEYDEEEV